MKIIIGTRGSDLALWQAYYTKDLLEQKGAEVEIKIIKTQGDKIQHLSFDKMEGKGFFTKEIEEELLNGSIDLAVHSNKDLETTNPEGLTIAATPVREDARDILLINKGSYDPNTVLKIKAGATIGTSSARRKAQITHLQSDLDIKDLRGNVPTRVGRLDEGYDAIVLAYAGLKRLNLDVSNYEQFILPQDLFVPAPAQGALAYQTRASDKELNTFLAEVNNKHVEQLVNIERGVLKSMDGGCQLPLGVHAVPLDENRSKAWVFFKGEEVKKFEIEADNKDLLNIILKEIGVN